MISSGYSEAYVWIWLPDRTEPVVAGRLAEVTPGVLQFNYGQSYLSRPDAIAIYEPELPLQKEPAPLLPGLSMPGCLRDAAPDAWGRRVILNRRAEAVAGELDELTYLLESGSDRIGALDFQQSAKTFVPRHAGQASLAELMEAAEQVERGVPLSPELNRALLHGTSLGGARPKVLLEDERGKQIAKFSASTDLFNVVKAEFVAMRLAAEVGLDVARVALCSVLGKDILLVERFDRISTANGYRRRPMVSALTLFGLDEMMAAHASYEELAAIVRHRFTAPKTTLRELYGRMVFNILCGNTDDHARNHAAFWDGRTLKLTPAYDICPQSRFGGVASQAMRIRGAARESRLRLCLDVAEAFLLAREEALALVRRQIEIIQARWEAVCAEAALPTVDRLGLMGRQFLNPSIFEGLGDDEAPVFGGGGTG